MNIFKEPPKQPRRTTQLKIVVTSDEKKAIDALAERLDMSISDLVRTALNDLASRSEKSKKR